jgi:DNA-directed RNA polymerase III subunit RPC8
MFVITTVADTVRVPPSHYLQPTLDSVNLEIDKKYPNRVILDVGLVICRFGDAIEISEGICAPGDGGAHYEVVFRLIVFRPLVEEICIGTIAESNEDGIRITLGDFFHDIFLPGKNKIPPFFYYTFHLFFYM